MAPNGNPHKCLILVGEGFSILTKPMDNEKTCPSTLLNENKINLSNLNRLAKEGSSGTLMIEEWNFEGNKINDVLQLLGLANIEKEKMSQSLKERYNNMKINLLSNDALLITKINQNKILENSTKFDIDFKSNNESLLKQQISAELEKSNILMVHLKLETTTEAVENGLKWFDSILSDYLNNDDVICSVALSYADRYNPGLIKYYEKPQLQKDESQSEKSKDFILPQQSGCHKMGNFVKVESVPISVCTRHNGSIRNDLRERFSEEDCKNGGNSSILTYHYIAEIAYKLGFTAKFGA